MREARSLRRRTLLCSARLCDGQAAGATACACLPSIKYPAAIHPHSLETRSSAPGHNLVCDSRPDSATPWQQRCSTNMANHHPPSVPAAAVLRPRPLRCPAGVFVSIVSCACLSSLGQPLRPTPARLLVSALCFTPASSLHFSSSLFPVTTTFSS
ncbi:uncharacterized protein B0I36DRAFT_146089 [Microdochium trichocladiopsis]|uniref:Uncharacterized protein n=1 Tax=Microdochium trichocladiopsis TaxID=1682393 RepID=A0A9P8Y327_9PEZI|nr:uncharacterized protein B0I36DRAFT_146089 [Microdochium trichocladiopsis]KAH7027993.1 hypothetical protein B0I36DRAFT_146089 [Microdochium trichocladiopsis]